MRKSIRLSRLPGWRSLDRRAQLVIAVIVILAVLWARWRDGTPAHEELRAGALMSASVVRVVDGDTAVFLLEGGTEEKVRFIGVDTPESTNSHEVYGAEASAYTKRRLPAGSLVYLEVGAEVRDRYGRLLAYVWLEKPVTESVAEVREKMLNARLALDGYAQQMTIQPNSKYADVFRACVSEARGAERGLWSPDVLHEAEAAGEL